MSFGAIPRIWPRVITTVALGRLIVRTKEIMTITTKLKRKLAIVLVALFGIATVGACTPEEIQAWASLGPVQQQQVVSAVNPDGSHRELGRQMAYAHGYSEADFKCLDNVINRESAWYIVANKGGSSAFGIPQAMLSIHKNINNPVWKSSPTLQIEWLFSYIDGRYGSPCQAWEEKKAKGWY